MKPSLVATAIKHAIKANRPIFLWGAPGVGKSDVVRQVADELYGHQKSNYFIDLRLLLLDPVDLRGLPRLNGDNLAHWCPPDFLPKAGKGILFLDELNAAPPLVQASGYQLVLNGAIGEYKLPKGWYVIAAGNRESDRAVTHRMPSPLANRFVHLDFDVDLEDWVGYCLRSGIRTDVISFIRHRPNLLHVFDTKKDDKAFPTPRSWVFVSQLLETNLPNDVKHEMIVGTVGKGAAAEFIGYLKLIGKMPNIDDIMLNPDKVDVPKDPAILYAIVTALAVKASDQTFERILKYVGRMPQEYGVLTVRDAYRANPDITKTRAYIDWAHKHAELMV